MIIACDANNSNKSITLLAVSSSFSVSSKLSTFRDSTGREGVGRERRGERRESEKFTLKDTQKYTRQ